MQQIIHKTKINLINHTNDINFPSYYENQNSPLLTTQEIIDLPTNLNYQSGTINILDDQPVTHNNILYIYLTSKNNNPFYYIIGNNDPIQTNVFCYSNLQSTPLETLSIFNGNLYWDGYYFNTIPNLLPNTIDYFLIKG